MRRPFLLFFRSLREGVLEAGAIGGDVDALHLLAAHLPVQELDGEFRQHGVGEDGVDHAPARRHLVAARDDQVDDRVVVPEGDAVVLGHALDDAVELQLDDALQHLRRERIVGQDDQAPQKRRREHLQQVGAQLLGQRLRIGLGLLVLRQAGDQVGADVGGEQDQAVLEVDIATLRVVHVPLVEHLEEHLVDVGVGLLHLVEQHDAVGPPPHRLGQHPALAVADVARGRALQGGDSVRLLELAHVDDDHGVVAGVEQLAEHVRRLGLADAGGSGEHEHADRLVGVVQLGAAGLDALGDRVHRVVLAHDPLLQLVGDGQDAGDLVLDHPADGDARPVAHHGRDGVGVDLGEHHGAVALGAAHLGQRRVELGLGLGEGELGRGLDGGFRGGGVGRPAGELDARGALVAGQRRDGLGRHALRPPRGLEGGPRGLGLLERGLLGVPLHGDGVEVGLGRRQRLLQLGHPVGRAGVASLDLALGDLDLDTQQLDPALAVLHLSRGGVLADGDARGGGVQKAHRLVGQLPRGDVAL